MRIVPLLMTVALLGAPALVRAGTVLTNLYYPYDYNIGVGNANAATPYLGHSFYTGASPLGLWQLEAITLLMDPIRDTPGAAFELALYSDDGEQPLTRLATLAGPSAPDGWGTEHRFEGEVVLLPHTTYWIIASAPSTEPDGAYQWGGSDYTAFNFAESGWGSDALRALAISSDGIDWTIAASSALSVGFLYFEIEAMAIPEPSALVWLLSGAALGVFLQRRRKRA